MIKIITGYHIFVLSPKKWSSTADRRNYAMPAPLTIRNQQTATVARETTESSGKVIPHSARYMLRALVKHAHKRKLKSHVTNNIQWCLFNPPTMVHSQSDQSSQLARLSKQSYTQPYSDNHFDSNYENYFTSIEMISSIYLCCTYTDIINSYFNS